MDPLRVNEILETVREDHELVVEQLGVLEELESTLGGDGGPHLDRTLESLRAASRFFQTKLLPHLQEEEQGLFRLFRDCLPKGSTLVYELEAEHAQMRELCERLHEEVALLRHVKNRRAPVFSDLRDLCARIARLLEQHAERENTLVEHFLIPTVHAGMAEGL
jgi:hemerythrin-like domain-containing protein